MKILNMRNHVGPLKSSHNRKYNIKIVMLWWWWGGASDVLEAGMQFVYFSFFFFFQLHDVYDSFVKMTFLSI